MGESKHKQKLALGDVGQGSDRAQVVDTLGGRMHVRWDEGAAATPHGQLVFFAEFLAANRKRRLSLQMFKKLHTGLHIPYESLMAAV